MLLADGSRIHLQQSYDSLSGKWPHDSNDGTFIHLNPGNGKLRYPDGTLVKYDLINNRLLPSSIRTRNGGLITIGYKTFLKNQANPIDDFKYRWAISTITDSLGRVTQFHYYGEKDELGNPVDEYLADDANGTGYLFPEYSSYGMIRYVSVRNNMTGAAGAATDGTEIAYTKYTFQETGTLSDSPQYTARSEWWQDKTDDSGNPTSAPTSFGYARTIDSILLTETNTVTHPNGLQVATVSDNNPNSISYGKVLNVFYKDGAATRREIDYSYLTPADGGLQVSEVLTIDDINQKAKVAYDYGSYGRVTNVYEYGFKSGTWTIKRRSAYQYSDDANYLSVNLLRVVTEVDVYDARNDNDNGNDVLNAKTVYTYDNYAIKGGMEYYGLTSGSYPPNHDAGFDQNSIARGNVTGVETFSSISPAVSTTRYTKWDIFGNVVQSDVSCCQVKNFTFNSSNYWSQPVSATDGTPGVVPFLTTNYQYDFNTGLVTQTTDPAI